MEKNILVIDDDDAFLYIINRLIKKAYPHYNVTVIDDSENGIDYLSQENINIDLVFLDLNMPAMDGGEILEKVYESKFKKPHFIVTSSADFSKEKVKFMKYDFVKGYLVKPVDSEKLKWALKLVD